MDFLGSFLIRLSRFPRDLFLATIDSGELGDNQSMTACKPFSRPTAGKWAGIQIFISWDTFRFLNEIIN